MNKFIQDFKTFAMRGNVIDLAVAVVIGTAFGKIVSSLVENIITPLMGILIGGLDFSNLSITIGDSSITYGAFIQSIVDFIIIALVIFLAVRALNTIQKKKEQEEKPAPKTPEDIVLLTEIRDLLKK